MPPSPLSSAKNVDQDTAETRAGEASEQPQPQDRRHSSEESVPGAPSDSHAMKGKEKKKVGFAGDATTSSRVVLSPGPSQRTPTITIAHDGQGPDDYFSVQVNPGSNGLTTPSGLEIAGNRESFNRDELTAALAKILQPEHHGGPLPLPRPVLRKNTTLGSPVRSYALPHRSEVEARNRADRLAVAIGSASAPASRRSSFDADETRLGSPSGSPNLVGRDTRLQGVDSYDLLLPGSQPDQDINGRNGAQEVASELVRSHTRRGGRRESQPKPPVPRSGTATPVAHDLEYVPRPAIYRGGILGSILKLYDSGEKSAHSSITSTPNRTPVPSPPTSRSVSPRPERPRSGLWSLRARDSSSTLAGLIESSAMFATPGSRDISEAVSGKLRVERERERPKKLKQRKPHLFKQKLDDEQYRITVHIAEIISRHQYLVKLCRALMMYGAPTHRLEAYMSMSARVLGIEGQFMYLPGTMIISFDDSNTHTTEVKIVRVGQGVDLGRLRDVHEIYKEVVHDLIGVEEATARLDEVIDRRNMFPTWVRVLLYGVASACVAPFGFEGRYIDMPIAFILGCIVGGLQLVAAPSNELYANVFEISAAVLTSFLSRLFGSVRGGSLFCFSSLAQSSIALILPGYMVLCSSLELQSHQMVAGSVRMVYALIYSVFLGYGITIGSVIYGYIDHNAVSDLHCSTSEAWYTKQPSSNFYLLFVLPFTLCLCAVNQAKWNQMPVMVVISLAGYCVSSYSSHYFEGNSTLSNTLGALCIGVLANFYSRLGRYVENFWLDVWEKHLEPRVWRLRHGKSKHRYPGFRYDKTDDPEAQSVDQPLVRHARKIGYGLAAAAMLPAIFVQVPSGLAVGGSLLSGITSADAITRNETVSANGTVITGASSGATAADLNSTAFNVLFSVIQVAIGISVGLSLSALLVYPLGKRRSGLFSL